MKIILVQLGRIGDMVLLTPLFRIIKEKYPDAEIEVVASRRNFNVIQNNPRLNRIIVYEKSPLKFLKSIRNIRQKEYDYLIDPKDHYSRESRILARFVKAKKKIGFNGNNKKIYDFSIPSDIDNAGLHSITRIFNSLKPLSISIGEKIPKPELFTNPESEKYVISFLSENEIENFIMLNLSAGSQSRMLTIENWSEILEKIIYENRLVLSFTSTESEMASNLLNKYKNLSLFKSRSINDVISLVNRAELIITPNTSLVHIASAFDTPIIAFYSSNEEDKIKFSPLSSKQFVLRFVDKKSVINDIDAAEVTKAINTLSL